METLILASQSPRRKVLLQQIGLKFKIIPSHSAELIQPMQTPQENAQRLALEKAAEVASHLRKGMVIGADTIVVLDRHILGKPKTKEEAKRMLRMLSGREHSVFTGFALIDVKTKKQMAAVEETRVRFRRLDDKEIVDYVNSGSPMDKAGAYGIQDDYGAVFVEKIHGCFYNVVGFPLTRFYIALKTFTAELEKGI